MSIDQEEKSTASPAAPALTLPDSSYARQLRRGFANLRFEGELESEFRASLRDKRASRTQTALLIGAALIVALVFYDLTTMESMSAFTAGHLRAFLIVPAILATYWFSCQPQFRQYLSSVQIILGWLICPAALAIGIIAHRNGVENYFLGLVVATFYIYFAVGLRCRKATATAFPHLLLFLAVSVLEGLPTPIIFYNGLFLFFSNVIGILGSYQLEESQRRSFLETRLLNEVAGLDALTGIPNRLLFDQYSQRAFAMARREGRRIAVLLIDIDYFKRFNDHYGHLAGDQCLREVAQAIRPWARRPLDVAARFGGEEFALVIYDPHPDHLRTLAQEILGGILDLGVSHDKSDVSDRVTGSLGAVLVGPADHPQLTLPNVLSAADRALYQAKDQGRNQAVIQDLSLPSPVFRQPMRRHSA